MVISLFYKDPNCHNLLYFYFYVDTKNIGIGAGHAVNYHNDCEGTKLNYRVLGAALSKMRSSTVEESAAFFEDGDWKADIDKDFKGRKK